LELFHMVIIFHLPADLLLTDLDSARTAERDGPG
jgi:hypothetical protein